MPGGHAPKSPCDEYLENAIQGEFLIPDHSAYRALVDLADRQFDYCAALDRGNSEKTDEKSRATRQWWSVVNAVLWYFLRKKGETGEYPDPVPMFTLARLANLSEDLSNGIILPFISDVSSRGKARPYLRAERHAIAYGVLYIDAALRGEIDDRRAKSTVAESYGVSAQTVRNWLKRRDEITVGIPSSHKEPEELDRRMRHHGATFARIGRSTMKRLDRAD